MICVGGAVDLATDFGDPSVEGFSVGGFNHRHFCATAYVHAAELVQAGVDNPYDLELVPPMHSGTLPSTAAHMAPFELDRYGYPPQFLLVPTAVLKLPPDFTAFRALWTCVNAIFFAGVLWRLTLGVDVADTGDPLRACAPHG